MSKFSDEVEKLRKSRRDAEDARRAKVEHPKGFEPGVHLVNGEGTLTTKPVVDKIESRNQWDAHLEHFGFNPSEFEVIDNKIEYRSWEAPVEGGKQTMHYYKVAIRAKDAGESQFDFSDIIKQVKSSKTVKPTKPKGADNTYVLALSDWQVGKQDGDGVEGIVKRVNQGIVDIKQHIADLKKIGYKFDSMVIAGLGDLVEGCDGHYPMQTYSVQLNQRDQITVATALIVKVIKEFAPLFSNLKILTIGGNHGENRKNGKSYTDFGDNYDVLCFDQAQKILAENTKAYGHLSWFVPDKELTMTLDLHGKILGIAHGHQFRVGGTNHGAKVSNWLSKQALAKTAIGDSDIMLSAHFHHLSVLHERNTTFIQAPALDGGSLWIEQSHALTSQPGILTFTVSAEGIDNIKVHKGTIE